MLLGPRPLLDTRHTGALAPGAVAELSLPALPSGSRAVLVDVSLIQAAGPGEVVLVSTAGEVIALQLPGLGAQTSATVVVPIGADNQLRVRTAGGGHAVVSLIGAFEPAETATSGRIVPLPVTRVLRLVPETDGKDATIDLAPVPALAQAGPVAAVLLQIAADVGTRGGFVIADGDAAQPDQQVFWSATAGPTGPGRVRRRARHRLGGPRALRGRHPAHRRPGRLRHPRLGARVHRRSCRTGDRAGPDRPDPGGRRRVGGDEGFPLPDSDQPPADRVGAVLLRLRPSATGPAASRYGRPTWRAEPEPNLTAAPGVARSAQALVRTVDGAVLVSSAAGASVTLIPQAAILSG